jgi:hypothetical protein
MSKEKHIDIQFYLFVLGVIVVVSMALYLFCIDLPRKNARRQEALNLCAPYTLETYNCNVVVCQALEGYIVHPIKKEQKE